MDSLLKISGHEFELSAINRIVVVGFGKASGAMALGLERSFTSARDSGIELPAIIGQINVPDDLVVKTEWVEVAGCRPAGENLPTERVVEATKKITELVSNANANDVCICLISGGGSALLELPEQPVTLDEFRTATTFLSRAGADINELNAVRRNISHVKGGGLAALSGGAPIISLIVSDVIGDPLDVIASGPTSQPLDTVSALDVLNKFDPDQKNVGSSIWNTVKTSNPKPSIHCRVENIIIGNVETAMNSAAEKAKSLGYHVDPPNCNANEGDAEEIGRRIADRIYDIGGRAKFCMIHGGETTVRVGKDPGDGGRNQHLVLAAIDEFLSKGNPPPFKFCLLSGGSDGEDGTKSVAGAFVDDEILCRLLCDPKSRNSTREFLESCNSYAFHQNQGTHLNSGPTQTNVCDLRILIC